MKKRLCVILLCLTIYAQANDQSEYTHNVPTRWYQTIGLMLYGWSMTILSIHAISGTLNTIKTYSQKAQNNTVSFKDFCKLGTDTTLTFLTLAGLKDSSERLKKHFFNRH